ncbi:replication initiator [Pseudonocardia dioxanivorans]|uniref:replication initiator n=1 Tax=Pseudonocardia dioxanivorans TaxID=240495 RepID=UPI00031D35CB|nr:replication initiator [Pseudonocardia dioxanivorans]
MAPTPASVRPGSHLGDLLRRVAQQPQRDPVTGIRTGHEFDQWLAHIASTRGCVRPVRLTGHLHTVEKATGRLLESRHTASMPDGVLYVPCGDRRASVCPACAETYRADTFQLIKAGLVGGKGVPTTVTGHPAVFATTTAPSFGPVHTRRVHPTTGKVAPCRMRRTLTRCPHGKALHCTARHHADDPSLGRPICLDCYDHAGHVVWNGWAGELWRRTMIGLNRALKPWERTHGVRLRISYGKVAEYQRRGVVHFHALLRLDAVDPEQPDTVLPPPAAITAAELAELAAPVFAETAFHTPGYADTDHTWLVEWGRQLDIRPVAGMRGGQITSEAVAAYLAKYATKATETTGLPVTKRMNAETAAYYANTSSTHVGRLVAYAWHLGARPATWTDDERRQRWHETYGRLRRWTHMLGFGGHFSTKSRRYSTTHKQLRAARRTWQRRQVCQWRRDHGLDAHDDDTTLVVTDLVLAGIGWHTTADAQLATQAATRAREHRALAREERTTA